MAGSVVDDSLRWLQSGSSLSAREGEVLGLVACGRSVIQIGRLLGIRPHTVRRHRANLGTKLNLRGKAALTRAIQNGLARDEA